jgi:hypothetical protein
MREEKVVDTKEPVRLEQEKRDCPVEERRRRWLGSLGGEIVC